MTGLLNVLAERRRKNALSGLLANPAMEWQARVDNAPTGSVGAPGGLLTNPHANTSPEGMNALQMASFAPGLGDAAGLLGDAQYLYQNPEERTPLNYGLSAAGALPFVPSMAAMKAMAPGLLGMTAFHGSPHRFLPTAKNKLGEFDSTKIGTGEGAQAYGHGIYLAEQKRVAGDYKTKLSRNTVVENGVKADFDSMAMDPRSIGLSTLEAEGSSPQESARLLREVVDNWDATPGWPEGGNFPTRKTYADGAQWLDDNAHRLSVDSGNLYTVDLPDEHIDRMLDWDAPLSEQPEGVRDAIAGLDNSRMVEMFEDYGMNYEINDLTGRDLYRVIEKAGENELYDVPEEFTRALRSDERASMYLNELGIPGIKYYDQGSRTAGEGTRNFVVFSDDIMTITGRE